jgi:hypothetical protein
VTGAWSERAEAVAVHLNDMDVMGETVEERADEPLSEPNTEVYSSNDRLLVTNVLPRKLRSPSNDQSLGQDHCISSSHPI